MSPTLRLRMSTMRGVSYSNRKAPSTAQQPAMAPPPRRPALRSRPGCRPRRRVPAREPRLEPPFAVGRARKEAALTLRGRGRAEGVTWPSGTSTLRPQGGRRTRHLLRGNEPGGWGDLLLGNEWSLRRGASDPLQGGWTLRGRMTPRGGPGRTNEAQGR